MSRLFSTWVLFALVACGGSIYPGYKEVASDVHMCYIRLGDGDRLAADSDSVLVRLRCARPGEEVGSIWSSEQWYLVADMREGAMLPILRRLHEGDSMSVIAPSARWPWKCITGGGAPPTPDTVLVQTELALLSIRTPAMIAVERERMQREDPEGYERRLIDTYLRSSKDAWTRWGSSDLYYRITGVARDTNRVRNKQLVQLEWSGRSMEDGRIFDVQGTVAKPIPWLYGTPDQVVVGIETAVMLLREGQEGEFIIPSSMAFGAKGIPGAVEPWTPVIYSVRLISVERPG